MDFPARPSPSSFNLQQVPEFGLSVCFAHNVCIRISSFARRGCSRETAESPPPNEKNARRRFCAYRGVRSLVKAGRGGTTLATCNQPVSLTPFVKLRRDHPSSVCTASTSLYILEPVFRKMLTCGRRQPPRLHSLPSYRDTKHSLRFGRLHCAAN